MPDMIGTDFVKDTKNKYPEQLNQAFLNMIINSIKATKELGTMSIMTWESEIQVHVDIKEA